MRERFKWGHLMLFCAGINFMGAINSLARGRILLLLFNLITLTLCLIGYLVNEER